MSNPERNLLAQALVEDVLEYGKTVYLVEIIGINSIGVDICGRLNYERYYCTTEEKAMALMKRWVLFDFHHDSPNPSLDISIDDSMMDNSKVIEVSVCDTSNKYTLFFHLTKILINADVKI